MSEQPAELGREGVVSGQKDCVAIELVSSSSNSSAYMKLKDETHE